MVDFRSVIATDFMGYLWREVQFLFLAKLQLSTRQLQWFGFTWHLFFDYLGSWYGKLKWTYVQLDLIQACYEILIRCQKDNNESMVDFRSVIATDFMGYLWREVQFLFLAKLQLSTRQLQWFGFTWHLFFDYLGSWYGKLKWTYVQLDLIQACYEILIRCQKDNHINCEGFCFLRQIARLVV